MIVKETLAVRADIDFLLADKGGFADSLFRQLTRSLIAYAEDRAFFVGSGSTFMQRGRADAATYSVPFVCYWCPDPTLGVEFRGGPNDGKIISLPRQPDGRPVDRFRLPPESAPPSLSDFRDEVTPHVMNIGDYERAGIDSVLDRWVYCPI